jgi:DNA uptake protein ComE-like DNA-binding protein
MLIAPDRGSNTRRRLRETMEEAGETVRRHPLGRKAMRKVSQAAEGLRSQGQSVAEKLGLEPLVALNTMSREELREELMEIQGIGPVLAERIIEGRPYTNPKELVERGIISENLLEEVKDRLKAA